MGGVHPQLSDQCGHRADPLRGLSYFALFFPSQEDGIAIPPVQFHLRRCRRVWDLTRKVLPCTTKQSEQLANRHWVPAPDYQIGHSEWLSTKTVPLWVDSQKLAPRFISLFPILGVINPVTEPPRASPSCLPCLPD